MLALLFLFIADTSPHQHLWVPVDLPIVQNPVPEPRAVREDAMRVTLSRDGSVHFRQDQIAREELSDLLQKALRDGAEKKVYLAADRRAKYSDVEVILDQIRLAGVTNVVILANKSTH